MSEKLYQELSDAANQLRLYSLASTTAAGSGHPTSCFSMAELTAVLFFHTMKLSISDPKHPSSDRFVLSKGHAAPILYSAWTLAGLLTEQNNLELRKFHSDIEGHPTPRLNFVDVATGSLGQGLSCGCGMAYVGKYFDNAKYRTYVIMGDGESAEGSVWEAMAFGSYYKLDNLVAIFDVNRLGQSQPTSLGHQVEIFKQRAEAFGWHTIVIDGHSIPAIVTAFNEAGLIKDKPTCIVAKTYKGHGSEKVSNLNGFHGKALPAENDAIREEILAKMFNKQLGTIKPMGFEVDCKAIDCDKISISSPPDYKLGQLVATRKAYGTALIKLGETCPYITTFDADVKNSTFSLDYATKFPDRHVECFIAEQNMVGVAIGAACRRRRISFCSTFACFLSRAYDQIRMGAISQTEVNFVGSHCGVSIGEDGPSQMALEDLSMFRAIPGCVVFYPSDGTSTIRAIELAANYKGMTYTRTSRPATPVLYNPDEEFNIGKGKILIQSGADKITVIGAGITLHEAMKAAESLKAKGRNVRVVDPFTLKPIDKELIIKCARATGGKIITVEDHYIEGGLGEAVCGAVSNEKDITVKCLAVREVPRSGQPEELIDYYGISAKKIEEEIMKILS